MNYPREAPNTQNRGVGGAVGAGVFPLNNSLFFPLEFHRISVFSLQPHANVFMSSQFVHTNIH